MLLMRNWPVPPRAAPRPEPFMPENCIFCKIAAGETPSAKIYEDGQVLAFLDLNPVVRGHTLVVPKTHAATLLDLPPGFGDAMLAAMSKVGKAQMDGLGAQGFNCFQNNFSAAGQVVMHLHWHVIPRFSGDGLAFAWIPGNYGSQDEMLELAAKLNSLCRT